MATQRDQPPGTDPAETTQRLENHRRDLCARLLLVQQQMGELADRRTQLINDRDDRPPDGDCGRAPLVTDLELLDARHQQLIDEHRRLWLQFMQHRRMIWNTREHLGGHADHRHGRRRRTPDRATEDLVREQRLLERVGHILRGSDPCPPGPMR